MFTLLALVLFVLGTNYQNNLILAVCYLQVSVLLVTMLHTFFHLSGLSLRLYPIAPVFAHQALELKLGVESQKPRPAITFTLEDRGNFNFDLSKTQSCVVMQVQGFSRGMHVLPALTCSSTYPFGLFRAWSPCRFKADIVVYPEPIQSHVEPESTACDESEDEGVGMGIGQEEFSGLRAFEPGASLKHVAWRQYAQGRGMWLKAYESPKGEHLTLDYSLLPGTQEDRLSNLCFQLLQYEICSLLLPGQSEYQVYDSATRERALKALAEMPVKS